MTIKQGIWNVNNQKYIERTCFKLKRMLETPLPGRRYRRAIAQPISQVSHNISSLRLICYNPYLIFSELCLFWFSILKFLWNIFVCVIALKKHKNHKAKLTFYPVHPLISPWIKTVLQHFFLKYKIRVVHHSISNSRPDLNMITKQAQPHWYYYHVRKYRGFIIKKEFCKKEIQRF